MWHSHTWQNMGFDHAIDNRGFTERETTETLPPYSYGLPAGWVERTFAVYSEVCPSCGALRERRRLRRETKVWA